MLWDTFWGGIKQVESPEWIPASSRCSIIAKDVNQNSDLNEWDGGQLGVIVEFESKAAAQKAFNSSEFQEYIKYSGIENQLSLSIIG